MLRAANSRVLGVLAAARMEPGSGGVIAAYDATRKAYVEYTVDLSTNRQVPGTIKVAELQAAFQQLRSSGDDLQRAITAQLAALDR